MKPEDLIKRIDELTALAQKAMETRRPSTYTGDFVDTTLATELRSAGISFFARAFGETSNYYREFENRVKDNLVSTIRGALGILKAARDEISGGWMFTVRGIVSAELFSDFMDMARHLLEEHYKDPAAVMIGSVLEEHLRQLCHKNSIPTETKRPDGSIAPLKADTMNAELAKAGVYSKLYQKSITAWLDLRNKAAHGHYTEYTEAQVNLMLSSVLDFLANNPI